MPSWSNLRSTRSSSGSWLAKRIESRQDHPDVFLCGLRTIEGSVPGLGSRWKYRSCAVDPLVDEGIVTLNVGPKASLRLRIDADPMQDGITTRPSMGVFVATAVDTDAQVQVTASLGQLHRFGIEL